MIKISLQEAKDIKLMNRIDKKYIINFNQFCSLSNYIEDNYYIVVNEKDEYLLKYKSIYFDTNSFEMYNDHENKVKNRQKIRIREYSNGDKYLEIKTKKSEDFTKKIRIELKDYNIDSYTDWINKNLKYSTSELKPKIEIDFYRLTLINKDKTERITIDFELTFKNYITKKELKIKEIIIEVKKTYEENTSFENELNKFDIYPSKFSKYHIGIKKTS